MAETGTREESHDAVDGAVIRLRLVCRIRQLAEKAEVLMKKEFQVKDNETKIIDYIIH